MSLRVMTVNVRQPDAGDGPNAWPLRRALFVDTWLAAAPDIVGTQELHLEQAQDILAGAPDFAWFGRGRYGDDRDKHVGVFYRRGRFTLGAHGERWFSTTPDVPGSASWDIPKPRHLTWGVLESPHHGAVAVINTHFPYRDGDEEARRHAAGILLAQLHAFPAALPVIVTGDFNTPAGGVIHRQLCRTLHDAWDAAATRGGPAGTMHGFGAVASPRRIDWILYRAPGWRVSQIDTVTTSHDGRFPSDHYPVIATFLDDRSRL